MAKKVIKKTIVKVSPGNAGVLTIDLFGPGMTVFHKVGLAGLWMTLKALEDENDGNRTFDGVDGTWDRTDTSVTFRWKADPDRFFKSLIKHSFKVDKNGLLWFPALGEPMSNPQQSVVLQEAMLGTLLQHPQHKKADQSQKPKGSIAVDINGSTIPLKYHKIYSYAHQRPNFNVTGFNSIVGWQFPGGAVRHTSPGLNDVTSLKETPGRALALRFASLGAIFFEIRSRWSGLRPRYALVLPEIENLSKYSNARKVFLKYGVHQLHASGMAEAGFRVLAELKSAALIKNIHAAKCRVISFGIVPWSTMQKTRINLMTVKAGTDRDLRTFNLCLSMFPVPRLVRPEKGEPFWDLAQMPDLVARNLVMDRTWWHSFADFLADKERRDHILGYVRGRTGRLIGIAIGEKGGLAKMVKDTEAFPLGAERSFVMACHEAWRRRMGQIGKKARRENSNFGEQVNREFEKVRVSFARCKNATSLREAVTDFWARGGAPLKPLQDGWSDILGLLDDKNWQKARDLVLLALASYKPATKEEAEALEGLNISNEGVE